LHTRSYNTNNNCSCVLLAIETPKSNQEITDVIKYADIAFAAVYTLEMVIKVIALGFIMGSDAYLSDVWDFADFIVVIISYLSIFLPVRTFVLFEYQHHALSPPRAPTLGCVLPPGSEGHPPCALDRAQSPHQVRDQCSVLHHSFYC
jgi:hypothetical protein